MCQREPRSGHEGILGDATRFGEGIEGRAAGIVDRADGDVVRREVGWAAAQPTTALAATPPTMALGVVRKGKNDFGLAVRVQKRGLENSPQVETIRKKAKGEVDVRYIGQVTKRAAVPWYQKIDPAAPDRGLDRALQDHRRYAGRVRPRAATTARC